MSKTDKRIGPRASVYPLSHPLAAGSAIRGQRIEKTDKRIGPRASVYPLSHPLAAVGSTIRGQRIEKTDKRIGPRASAYPLSHPLAAGSAIRGQRIEKTDKRMGPRASVYPLSHPLAAGSTIRGYGRTCRLTCGCALAYDAVMPLDPNIPHQEITYRILGCAMRVHNRLGPGLREKMYQRALTAEMRADGLQVIEEYRVDVYDNDVWVGVTFPDHWVENKVVVEVEAFPHFLTKAEIAQTIGFLAATEAPVGLLINFGRKRLDYQRILLPKDVQNWKKHITRFLWRPPGDAPPQRAQSDAKGAEDSNGE